MSKQLDPLKTTTPELHTPFSQLIVSGCSFSAGTSLIDEAIDEPTTWSHFILKKVLFENYVNLAIPGGGNVATFLNLFWYLETHYCDPKDTLVILNVTEFDRIDTITFEHPDSNKYFSWEKDMGFGWITEGPFISKYAPFFGLLQKNMGYESTVKFTSMVSILVFEYLKNRGYNFKWMYMNDDCRKQIPMEIKKQFDSVEHQLVKFDQHESMQSFVTSLGLTVSETDKHPNIIGHSKIADIILMEIFNV